MAAVDSCVQLIGGVKELRGLKEGEARLSVSFTLCLGTFLPAAALGGDGGIPGRQTQCEPSFPQVTLRPALVTPPTPACIWQRLPAVAKLWVALVSPLWLLSFFISVDNAFSAFKTLNIQMVSASRLDLSWNAV